MQMDKYYKNLSKEVTRHYSLPLLLANFNENKKSDIDYKNVAITGQQKACSKTHASLDYAVIKFEKHISRMIEEFDTNNND